MWQDMSRFGKKLFERGFVKSRFGNISIRLDDKMVITKTGFSLRNINGDSIVEIYIDKPSNLDTFASSEAIVHKEIYKNTPARAIIHAHPIFAITESLLSDTDVIIPIDNEGQYLLHEIPIVRGDIGTSDLAIHTANALKNHKGVIVYSHGTFVIGDILEDAYIFTDQIERSCRLKYNYEKKETI